MKKLFTHVISLVVCGLLLFTGALQAAPDCAKLSGTGQTATDGHDVQHVRHSLSGDGGAVVRCCWQGEVPEEDPTVGV